MCCKVSSKASVDIGDLRTFVSLKRSIVTQEQSFASAGKGYVFVPREVNTKLDVVHCAIRRCI